MRERVSTPATISSTATLAVSDGWNENGPSGIHRWAPQRDAASPEMPGMSTITSGTRQSR